MSRTISCPFCQAQITIDENASAVVCMACGKGFSLGVTAQPGNMQPTMQQQFTPQMQFQQQPQQQFAPQMQYQQPPMMPVNGYNQAPRRRRPGNGLFTATIIINVLSILAAIGLAISVIGVLTENKYHVYSQPVYYDDNDGVRRFAYYDYKYYNNYDYQMFENSTIVFSIASGLLGIAATVLNLISIAKYWSMQPQHITQGKSPAAAACFLLIPFFNIYWLFALHSRLGNGFAQTTNFQGSSAKTAGIIAAILILLGSSQITAFLAPVGWILAFCAYQKAAKVIEP